jgi:hypothetical protein
MIVATGFDVFDAARKPEYGYTDYDKCPDGPGNGAPGFRFGPHGGQGGHG